MSKSGQKRPLAETIPQSPNKESTMDMTTHHTLRHNMGSRAVFVGGGSLLVSCGEAYVNAGHSIEAVLSGNPTVLQWAESRGIAAMRMDKLADIDLSGMTFDFLFSVANLQILPAAVVSQARLLAINFHDALLPDYAGLNATAWALMARESSHGITWHEMTPRVDGGRIVRQVAFGLSPEETALSLNAKCYEAGLASFQAMLDDISRGELTLTPQGRPMRYFSLAARPAALATLDFSDSAQAITALVRALDFGVGHYVNPLARPKIFTSSGVVLVQSASVSESGMSPLALPGTVLDVQGDTLQIAAADGVVVLGGCGLHGLERGMVLPALSLAMKKRLAARTPQVGRGEAHWFDTFAGLAPVELPYPQLKQKQKRLIVPPGFELQQQLMLPVQSPHFFPLQVAAQGPRSVAGFTAWLAALTGQTRLSIFYGDAVLSEQAEGLEPWLSPWVPLTLRIDLKHRIADAAARTEAQIGLIHQAGPCPTDLPTRLADKPAGLLQSMALGVCLSGWPSVNPSEAPALLLTVDASCKELVLVADSAVYAAETAKVMAAHLAAYLTAFEAASDEAQLADISLLPQAEADLLRALNASSATPYETDLCTHEAISARAALTPTQVALTFHGRTLSYQALEQQSSALAGRLLQRGVQPGDVVGLHLERSPDLIVGLLAIWKVGAAYLPLDPAYPVHRLSFMVDDSATRLVLTTAPLAKTLALPSHKTLLLDAPMALAPEAMQLNGAAVQGSATRAAYVIYTSGSTGKPKGVVVTHRNVMNFFAGMSQRVPHEAGARWLAVTSLSFDISVLELCWTLSRGLTVVLHSSQPPVRSKTTEFSLFYFGNDNQVEPQQRYDLLFEGARFADREGFSAVWTPECHFHAFGGMYPNPAMTSAALAAITTRVKIRAGSSVLPLHHPIRVAEDWAVVDNISHGRVGVSFAAGWQPNDFVIAPEVFATRKQELFERIKVVRRLWRGESVAFDNPLGSSVDIKTLPRPIQAEIPVWVTAAGSPETFEQAGTLGLRLLTHLLGQNLTDVAAKISLYHAAWRQAGHAGSGHVTMMLHTFVGDDNVAVRETVREPMKAYLRSAMDLVRQAAWTFPTFVQRSTGNGKTPLEIMESEPLSEADMDALLEHAFARYYDTSALFGSPQRCLAMVALLRDAGVDEIGCLIDFGVQADEVLLHLRDLKNLMDLSQQSLGTGQRVSVADDILQNEVTHLQCTPSMASMLVADAAGHEALSRLSVLLVGGEALPLELARQLTALVPGKVLNMYGPTETTVWSTVCDVSACDLTSEGAFVSLGQAIANTQLSVRSAAGLDCPALVPGELLIGGDGVTLGYLGRPELTAERFMADADVAGGRLYRTGDLVRRHPSGELEFLGRTDHQVKIRGHRIELGEIESLLLRQPGVKQAVVMVREEAAGGHRLVAYFTPQVGVTLAPEVLRQALAAELPEIMLPASLVVVLAFALTPNGKIDRLALPDPHSAIVVPKAVSPETEFEKSIAALWREVLGLSEVSVTDNFFDLGGHSLLVVQVQRRLREVSGREVSITDMFRFPTIRGLSQHLSGPVASASVKDAQSRARTRRNLRDPVSYSQNPSA
jgi:natural product biosynthesis luciferase-like monooxygenase protein